MRELARCLAWTLAIGMVALLFALLGGAGLEHVDGPEAWLMLAAYLPFYAFAHGMGPQPGALLLTAGMAAEFAYIFMLVALVRSLARRLRR